MDPYFSPAPDKLIERALKAEQQRDELLEVLKQVRSLLATPYPGIVYGDVCAAIAKIEGEK